MIGKPGAVVGELAHRAGVRPFHRRAELIGSMIDRHGKLHRIGLPEGSPPGLRPGAFGATERHPEVEGRLGGVDQPYVGNVTPRAEGEQAALRHEQLGRCRAVLYRRLQRVVQPEHTGRLRPKRRARISAVEERDLIPLEAALDVPVAIERRLIPLVAIADVIHRGLELPSGGVTVVAKPIQRRAVAEIPETLVSGWIAGYAAHAQAEVNFAHPRRWYRWRTGG